MKTIILGVLLFLGSITMAQATTTTPQDTSQGIIENVKSTVGQTIKSVDTSSTFKLMYSDFKSAIGAMASSLKVGAEHVYMVLVKQQIVKSITKLILFVIGIILMSNWIKRYKSDEEWFDDADPTGIGFIRLGQLIFSIMLILVGLICLDDIITGFINPEYGALDEIISWIHKK